MAELQAIIDAIIVIQKALAVPTDQKDIQLFTDEPPASIGALPAFVNLEEDSIPDDLAHGRPQITHRIGMHLVFAPASQKYAVRQLRPWIDKVLDAFTPDTTIGGTVREGRIVGITYEPFEWGETAYPAANFLLEVSVDR